jgi:hypothetical protein
MERLNRRLKRRLFLLVVIWGVLSSGGSDVTCVAWGGLALASPGSSSTLFEPEPASATAPHLPDTGQSNCYDNTKEIPCPTPAGPFYGQDAQNQGAQPSYRDNLDGTVSDLNTGLMWQQGDAHNDWGFGWEEAVTYCDALPLAGHADWRLPSRRELLSIVDYGMYNPAIDTQYFPGCLFDNKYWSSTVTANGPDSAWEVYFSYGAAYPDGKAYALYARCVRDDL